MSLPSVISTKAYQNFLMVSFLSLANFLLRRLFIGLQVVTQDKRQMKRLANQVLATLFFAFLF